MVQLTSNTFQLLKQKQNISANHTVVFESFNKSFAFRTNELNNNKLFVCTQLSHAAPLTTDVSIFVDHSACFDHAEGERIYL